MKLLLSMLIAILSGTGLLELFSRYIFGMRAIDLFKDPATQEEMDAHKQEWGYKERQHGFGHHHGFRAMMKKKMQDVRMCHMKCGMDKACHMQCPQPWKGLQEKCARAKPIMACHKACGRDHACHEQCPKPACPKARFMVDQVLKCHGSCGEDRACHRACPHPEKELMQKCEKLEKIFSCHKQCAWDRACHHTCPKMEEVWGHRDWHSRFGLPIHA